MPATLESADTLSCRITPGGRLELACTEPSRTSRRILEAFEGGNGAGVLHLGVAELASPLPPELSYWRFLAKTCATADRQLPPPDRAELERFLEGAPPMLGAETLTLDFLVALWQDMGRAVEACAGGLPELLKAHGSAWNVVGRVCLNLAENPRDPEFPFAFMATYVATMSQRARPQHLPLGQALREYAGARDRQKLLALLAPLSRAAEQSPWLAEMVESGDVYHPLSWSAADAYQFLREIELYERAGLVVRAPDWWSSGQRSRAGVTVSVGSQAPSLLGLDALLDFDVSVVLDGQRLTSAELERLLAAGEGLALFKGRWVEVNRQKLSEVLDHWRQIQKQAREGGVSFRQALQLLAGGSLGSPSADSARELPEWSQVVAGKWLAEKLEALRHPEVGCSDAGLKAQLRPYQRQGVHWLSLLRQLELGGCLADDMGLGKTIQVLGLLNSCRKEGTDLLVVPASLLDNWRLEAARFAPDLRLWVAHPSRCSAAEMKNPNLEQVDLVVTSYGTLAGSQWMRQHSWRHVILDEAQAIKNPATRQTQAVKSLRSRWRLALTGTPVENRLGDLWSIFDFLNPGLLGSAREFDKACKEMAARPQGYAALRRLVQPYILRRLKTDRRVIEDLPDKTEMTAHCLLSPRQAALYQQSVQELGERLRELAGIERRGVVLSFLMRFKQICNHPSQWLGDDAYGPADSGKFSRLGELCESLAERQDKVLIFTQFREMCQPLADYLAQVFGRPGQVLHGSTPVGRRQALVKSFQEDEGVPFMVLSLKAGGTGLNLTAAAHVIHFDRWWNPAVENQATDRAFRIGQKRNVLVHKFVCRGTVEDRIDELLRAKQGLSDEILSGGAETRLTELSNEELMKMVALDLNSALEAT